MNFKNLKLAIELNKDEPPSLTLAFYMMKSIVSDIEQESGKPEFRLTELGDTDQYTGLLGNQIRLMLRTYQATEEYLKGNLTRLEQLKTELETVSQELKDLEESVSRMHIIQEELDNKKKEKKKLEQ